MTRVLSVVVPLLNEGENLPALHAKLTEIAATLDRGAEFVFVDDGSTDGSFDGLCALRTKDERVRVIRLSRNFGSHAACLAGLARTSGDHAVILSADLQDPPELLRAMLAKADAGNDVVWAAREGRDDPALTVLFSRMYSRLMRKIALPNYPDAGVDFVLMSRRAVRVLVTHAERNSSIFGQVLWAGFPQTSVPYERAKRRAGRSKWTLRKKMKLAIDSVVAFSSVPIRAMSAIGLLAALIGVLYAAVIVVNRVTRDVPVEGWSSLMVVVLVLGGLQMVMLGVIGEYLWRTLDEARGRPSFIVADAIGFEGAPPTERVG